MDMDSDSQSRMQIDEQDRQQGGIPTMFTWSYCGKQVGLMGSWDGWKSLETLQGSGEDLDILKVLPSGVYNYVFVVDGQYRVSPDQPYHQDDFGNAAYNILDLKEYVPENIGSISGLEAPESPEGSYSNAEDYEKNKLPMLPAHLNLTLLNAPTRHLEISTRPQHVMLNHLYSQTHPHPNRFWHLDPLNAFVPKMSPPCFTLHTEDLIQMTTSSLDFSM